MKKFYFLLVLLLLVLMVNNIEAQDTLKLFDNRWATELNFDPFNGKFSLNNASGQIKLRKFTANNTAFRLAFTFGYQQDNSKQEYPYGVNPVYNKELKKSTLCAVNLGREKHFAGSRRFSPYIGIDLGVGLKISSELASSDDGSTKINGAWQEVVYTGNYYYSSFSERGFWSLGINMISGMDFYITSNFYMGCEIAFGLDYIKYSKIVVKENGENSNHPDTYDESWKFGPKLLNGIRIGYVF